MSIVLFAGVSCTLDQRQFKRRKYHCVYCKKEVEAFSVPAFGSACLRKIIFCTQCNGILSKPKKLYQYASPLTNVILYLDSGKNEKTWKDYPSDSFDIPLNVSHVCHDGNEVKLVKYASKVVYDHGEEEIFEEYFECPSCLQEKLLKHRESKLTLFNFEKMITKYEMLEINFNKFNKQGY